MFVLQLTGKFKRGNLLRRREKQQLAKPKVAIGMLNEVAALSSRDTADEEYVQQLQRTKAHRLTLVFGNAAFEEKYVAYHHAHWTPAALRARRGAPTFQSGPLAVWQWTEPSSGAPHLLE